MSNGWDQAPVGDSAYGSSDREPRSLWQPLRDTIRANSQFQQGLLTHRVQGDVIPPRPNVQQNAATFPALALQQAWDENQAQAHAQAHESNLPSGSAGPGQWPQQHYAPNQGYQYPPASQWPGQEIPRPSYSPRPTVSSPWTGQGVGFAGGGAQPSHLLRTWRGKVLMVTLKNGHEIIGVLNYISEDKGTEIFHLTQVRVPWQQGIVDEYRVDEYNIETWKEFSAAVTSPPPTNQQGSPPNYNTQPYQLSQGHTLNPYIPPGQPYLNGQGVKPNRTKRFLICHNEYCGKYLYPMACENCNAWVENPEGSRCFNCRKPMRMYCSEYCEEQENKM